MSTTAIRLTQIQYTGDVTGTEVINALANSASPASIELVSLSGGVGSPLTVTVPSGGTTPTAVTIVPPAGNAVPITLKGVSGDTGIILHLVDPTTIALGSTVTSFVLVAGASVTGIRLFWS